MDKQTKYIQAGIEEDTRSYISHLEEEVRLLKEMRGVPVGDLTDQIDKEFETYTRRLLSESKPYSDMTNKELRAESVQAVVLLLGEQKADEQ